MITFYHLFVAHLLADFVFQPQALVDWKQKSWKGLAVHVLIHWVLSILILSPYLPNFKLLLLLFGVTLSHFMVDMIKIRWQKESKRYVSLFFLDQAVHVFILLLATSAIRIFKPALQNIPPVNYFDPQLFAAIILGLLFTYFVEILSFQFVRQHNEHAQVSINWIEMTQRLVLFAILWIAFGAFGR